MDFQDDVAILCKLADRLNILLKTLLNQRGKFADGEQSLIAIVQCLQKPDDLDGLEHKIRAALLAAQALRSTLQDGCDSAGLELSAYKRQEGEVAQQYAATKIVSGSFSLSMSSLGTTCFQSESVTSSEHDCMSSCSDWGSDEGNDQARNIGTETSYYYIGEGFFAAEKQGTDPTGARMCLTRGSCVLESATVSRFQLRRSWSAPVLTMNVEMLDGGSAENCGLSTASSIAIPQSAQPSEELMYQASVFGCSPSKLMQRSYTLEQNLNARKAEVRALEDDLKSMLEKITSEGLALSSKVEDLAADAFDCAWQRTVPGAMEVFEDTGAEMDRISILLQACTRAAKSDGLS